MTCGVYKVGFSNTDKVYIGSSKNIERRFKQHKAMLNSGCHHSYKLQEHYSTSKDFIEMSVLQECSEENRTMVEAECIDKYNSILCGFNVAKVDGFGCSEEIQLKQIIHMPSYLRLCTRLLDDGLSHTSAVIASYMFNNYETCNQHGLKYFESIGSISDNTKSSISSVKSTIKKLVEKGIAQSKKGGIKFNTNYYEFDINYFMEDFLQQASGERNAKTRH